MKSCAFIALVALASTAAAQRPSGSEIAAWKRQAQSVTIVRDDWGIAHIHGKTDADAVFGMIYAQAEDDFNRVESNYIDAMGRRAESEGEAQVWRDLRMKIFIDPDSMKALYRSSPDWLRQLMDAWAAGLNYYLYTHSTVKPKVIARFEPWMALTFSEGSIGSDIERVNLGGLAAFYGKPVEATMQSMRTGAAPAEPSGSNGIAIAPSITMDHHALMLINPHTSFFFRSELQVSSDHGLDAYGAVTWGQFFVYQGFNPRAGWMHTSSGVDAVDEYAETVVKHGSRYYYEYGGRERPMTVSRITVPYRTASGTETKQFTVYRTHHGPIVRAADGKWVSIRLMQDPLHALIQSFTRTKATDYASFRRTMDLHTNSSNNTVFADADGDIAYFHANFIPRRDPRFDWSKPVDGSDSATEWHELLSVDETPHLLNPPNGWLYNSNNWPWSAAGANSPKQADFPPYVERSRGESFRGKHMLRELTGRTHVTLDTLLAVAFDSYLPAFAERLPSVIAAYDATPASDPLRARLADQVAVLRGWDYRWGVASVPTALAVYWGEALARRTGFDSASPPAQLLGALVDASDTLTADFGTWRVPWGDINRFQRVTDEIAPSFSDAGPSIPVGFTPSIWGSLASFGARAYPGTKKRYGTSGNSFVAVVEFGDSVRARAITAGGESGDPSSRHFDDEAERYATGNLREVYFYPSQLIGHVERTYHPGD